MCKACAKRKYYRERLKRLRHTDPQWHEKEKARGRYKARVRIGIKDPEKVHVLLARQNGVCAICKTTKPGGKGDWHADHDHETGLMRGMLCCMCNQGLGNFRDDISLLEAALKYLIRTPADVVRFEQLQLDFGVSGGS